MAATKFDGVRLSIGGRVFITPALTLRQLKQYRSYLDKFASGVTSPGDEDLDKIAEVLLAALNRNYPELTHEEVLDLVDINDMRRAVPAVLGVSGLEIVPAGEGLGVVSSGDDSTPKSPQ